MFNYFNSVIVSHIAIAQMQRKIGSTETFKPVHKKLDHYSSLREYVPL